ncbi:DUF2946 family protein [Chitinibacter bivalviorum]|uniref:DUF2946 family protein n=1 Tax=Chitinibacter bivalviorum TaxID=2739434 RepID=A0A7H9BMR5_9NEIS|nr:DUF2946 family protein [Chitinibacter bivalviorum]QLG88664.1 DUF2946 family protein [Chitinibacter bivalviorum]
MLRSFSFPLPKFAVWLALLAMLAQLLLPFVHVAAMDAGVSLAWCGKGKAPLQASPAGAQDGSDAKIIVKCSLCAVAGLQAIAPPPALIALPIAALLSHVLMPQWQEYFSPLSYAIPPPPRGPPLFS